MVDHAAPSPAPAAQADLMARDHDAPPSPYDPAYDFRNDPNAMSGGRWPAWNKYQKEKHAQARQVPVPDETARPGLRSAAERIGPARMVPGYNPPWAREGRANTRPPFAMEAAEAGLV